MRKTTLFALFIIFSISAAAQESRATFNDKYLITEAGMELKKFTTQYYIGMGLTVGGAIVTTANSDGNTIIAGSIMALAGIVVQIISHKHIGKAGQLLIESTYSSRYPGITGPPAIQVASAGIYLPLNKIRR